MPQTREVVAALTTIREARGWSQKDLADAMATAQSWLCGVETGRVPDPQVSTIIRMATALRVKASLTIYDPHTGDMWLLPLVADEEGS